MNLFISDAMAQAGSGGQQASPIPSFVLLILMVVVFYFLAIRPQSKRAKEHKKLIDSLTKGDEAVTSGGILGKVTKVDDNFITMEIANGVRINVQKHAVVNLMPKGTIKTTQT